MHYRHSTNIGQASENEWSSEREWQPRSVWSQDPLKPAGPQPQGPAVRRAGWGPQALLPSELPAGGGGCQERTPDLIFRLSFLSATLAAKTSTPGLIRL